MIGSNTLKLNQETICAAVQCYLATQYAAGKVPVVKSVKLESSNSRGYDTDSSFVVEVEGVATEAPKATT